MRISPWLLVALFILLYIASLGLRPIFMPDETRFAEVGREMQESGDWVVPRLDDLKYLAKPPAGYWLLAASIGLFGENAFAIRLPSAAAVAVTAVLLFLLGRRFAGGSSTGLLAALVYATCAEVFFVGTFNVLDSVLAMFLTGAMVAFYFAHMESSPGRKRGLYALSGAFCGLAFLTKGFLAFVLPIGIGVSFLVWRGRSWELVKTAREGSRRLVKRAREGRSKELLEIGREGCSRLVKIVWEGCFRLSRMAWIPVLAAVAVALPWSLLINSREETFWRYYFWVEHVLRFLADERVQLNYHPEPFWFEIPVFLGGGLPWTALLPALVSGLRRRERQGEFLRYCVCWFLIPFLFFSVSKGKLGTYILPCFAPFAILAAVGLTSYAEAGSFRLFRVCSLVCAAATGIAAVLLLVTQTTGVPGIEFDGQPGVYGDHETWKWLCVLATLLSFSALAIFAARAADVKSGLRLYAAAPFLVFFSTFFVVPDLTRDTKVPQDFLLGHADGVRPETILVSDDHLTPAVCWYFRRNDVYFLSEPGEFRYSLKYKDCSHRLLTAEQFREFVSERQHVMLFLTRKFYRVHREELPDPDCSDAARGFVLLEWNPPPARG